MRCNSRVAERRIQGLPLCNAEVVDSCGQLGGLWLLWGSDFKVTVRFKNQNVIVADVDG